MDSVFKVTTRTRLDGATQVELLYVQGIYFLSHSYVFAVTARPMWQNHSAQFWPMSGRLLTVVNTVNYKSLRNVRWRSWLRHCARHREVASSILDGVLGIFRRLNLSGRTIALV